MGEQDLVAGLGVVEMLDAMRESALRQPRHDRLRLLHARPQLIVVAGDQQDGAVDPLYRDLCHAKPSGVPATRLVQDAEAVRRGRVARTAR